MLQLPIYKLVSPNSVAQSFFKYHPQVRSTKLSRECILVLKDASFHISKEPLGIHLCPEISSNLSSKLQILLLLGKISQIYGVQITGKCISES